MIRLLIVKTNKTSAQLQHPSLRAFSSVRNDMFVEMRLTFFQAPSGAAYAAPMGLKIIVMIRFYKHFASTRLKAQSAVWKLCR